MPKSLYLINPTTGFPTYYGIDVYPHLGLEPGALIADLATTTVAAMVPDDFKVWVCDEQITPVDLNCSAEIVGITGKYSQAERMISLAQEFRQQDKIVIIGGPFASLYPETVRPYCDILVRGEIEEIADQIFADLREGRWQSEYVGSHPDLSLSPPPRWELYPHERTLVGSVQTSRGCPFECEFCDVIQYAGRKQRHKSVAQVLAELEVLYKLGYRTIFLADDNFTAHRQRAKELLTALRDWNHSRTQGQVAFTTQCSLDVAREEKILSLCREAGFFEVFLGIETPNENSLREVKKRQNIMPNLSEYIRRFYEYGIGITASMMIGFDADGPDIFAQHYEFAMSAPLPMFNVLVLVAFAATPLYTRLKQAGRLLPDKGCGSHVTPWDTNVLPKHLTHEELRTGFRWLCNKLYHPTAFGKRVLRFIEYFKGAPGQQDRVIQFAAKPTSRKVDLEMTEVIGKLGSLGTDEGTMLLQIGEATAKKPAVRAHVMHMLHYYMQIRYLFQQGGIWEPGLASLRSPFSSAQDLTLNQNKRIMTPRNWTEL